MKRRTSQVASSISRAAQEVLARGINDPRIRGMITVTGVDLTDDLKLATIKVTVMPEDKTDLTLHGLRSALPMIRKRVMQRVHIKEFPQLRIAHDDGMRAQARVAALLSQARAEEDARRASPGFDRAEAPAQHDTAENLPEPQSPNTNSAESGSTESSSAEPSNAEPDRAEPQP